jgi:hypothetical protein
MFNQLAISASKSSEPPPAHPGTPPDSARDKQPRMPEAPYQPYSEQPSVSELPYKPYSEKPAQHDPPYEPYKGI